MVFFVLVLKKIKLIKKIKENHLVISLIMTTSGLILLMYWFTNFRLGNDRKLFDPLFPIIFIIILDNLDLLNNVGLMEE